jgi:hypothetical protein
MDANITLSLLALAASVSATSWTIWYNLSGEKADKVNRTIDLQFRFSESDMVQAREIAWYLLKDMEEKGGSFTFEELWDNNDETARTKFNELLEVMNFWLVLHQLGEERKIDIPLAKRIFSYEYDWWFWRMRCLVENTINNPPPNFSMPDVFRAFYEEGISWLPKNGENKPERCRQRVDS